MDTDSVISDFSEISNANINNDWENISNLSQDTSLTHVSVQLPQLDDVKSISNDSDTIVNNNSNNKRNKSSNYISTINENESITGSQTSTNEPDFISSYSDIQRQLEISRETIHRLQEQLSNMTVERDQAIQQRDDLEVISNRQNLRIRNLQTHNACLNIQNARLRALTLKNTKKHHKKRLEIELRRGSKYGGDNKKSRHHKRSVSAKLKFRRSKTTHRTIYTNCRKW